MLFIIQSFLLLHKVLLHKLKRSYLCSLCIQVNKCQRLKESLTNL